MDDRKTHKKTMLKPYAKIPFEGRDDLIEVFKRTLEGKKPDEYRILVFHGMSGIGKTRLLEELEERFFNKGSNAIFAKLDFDVPTYRQMETGLFYLRESLKNKNKVNFNCFDIAYTIYWHTIHPQMPLTSNNFPLREETGLLTNIIDVAVGLPVASLIPKIGDILLKNKKSLEKWWVKRGQPLLQQFAQLKPFEMEKNLPVFLAEDIKQNFEKHQLPMVIFFDTYQAFWSDGHTDANKFTKDEWIRNLVEKLPEASWVIAGHDKICWSELDESWDEKIKHYSLTELSEETVFKILEQCGITDKDIQKRIFEGSKGVPFYIQLSIENYNNIIEKEKRQPVVDDFGKSYREIFERFAKYLDKGELETLKVLSCAHFWDKTLFGSAVREFNTGYPVNDFDKFCRFSFIGESTDSDTFIIHELFKKHIKELTLKSETIKDINKFFFNYYDNKLKEIDIKNITQLQETALTESFYHASEYMEAEDLYRWVIEKSENFRQAAQWQLLSSIYEKTIPILEKSMPPDHPHVATSLNNLALLYQDQGKYLEAEPLYRRALEIRKKVLGPDHPDVATSLNNLALLYYYQGKYKEAESLYRRALEIRKKVLGPDHPDVANSLNNLAELYRTQGKYLEAEPLYRRALEIRKKVLGPDHPDTATSLNNLAGLYQDQGKYLEAEPLYRRALEIREKVLDPDHPHVATSLNNLAGLYRTQGKYLEAEPLYKRALEILEKAFGEIHPNVATIYENMSVLYSEMGQEEKAKECEQKAQAIRDKLK